MAREEENHSGSLALPCGPFKFSACTQPVQVVPRQACFRPRSRHSRVGVGFAGGPFAVGERTRPVERQHASRRTVPAGTDFRPVTCLHLDGLACGGSCVFMARLA